MASKARSSGPPASPAMVPPLSPRLPEALLSGPPTASFVPAQVCHSCCSICRKQVPNNHRIGQSIPLPFSESGASPGESSSQWLPSLLRAGVTMSVSASQLETPIFRWPGPRAQGAQRSPVTSAPVSNPSRSDKAFLTKDHALVSLKVQKVPTHVQFS